MVEWVVQILYEWPICVTASYFWRPVAWKSFSASSLSRSFTTSTMASILAAWFPRQLFLSWRIFIKHTALMIGVIRNNRRLWDINILLTFFLVRFHVKTLAQYLLLLGISGKLISYRIFSRKLLTNEHMLIAIRHQHWIDHIWGIIINSSTIIVIMGLLVSWCIIKLRLIFLVLLNIGWMINNTHIIVHHWLFRKAFLRYLDLTSSHSVLDYVLSRCCTILHFSYLGLSLAASLSYSLNRCYDFLIVLCCWLLTFLLCFAILINFKLQNSIIRTSSSSIWGPSDTPTCFRFSCSRHSFSRYVWEFTLIALRGINSTINWPMACILVWNLKFLKTLIHIWTLSIVPNQLFTVMSNNFFAWIVWRMTVWAIADSNPIIALILNLRMVFSKLNLFSSSHLILLDFIHHLVNLSIALLELSLWNMQLLVDPCNLTLLLIKNSFKLVFQFFLGIFVFLSHLLLNLILFFFKFFNFFIQNFNMKLQLLFNFNVISYLCLVLLKLLFVFFWR